jgi:sulfide:quinone oxidoreductase
MRAPRRAPDETPLEVVVVGSGVAGLETVMALRALAGGRPNITLVTPESEFEYRPLAVGEPFDLGTPQRHELDRIATDFDVELVHDRLDRVAPGGQRVYTSAGDEIAYDAVVLAIGARPQAAWSHVVTFAGSRDADAVRSVVREIESGEVDSVAFVVPSGATWPLPLYELALLTARRAEAAGVHPELAVYTPEEEPLEVFGREASRLVAA